MITSSAKDELANLTKFLAVAYIALVTFGDQLVVLCVEVLELENPPSMLAWVLPSESREQVDNSLAYIRLRVVKLS